MDQLRDTDVFDTFFAPIILGLLGIGVSGTGRKPVKLDGWAVDEFYLSCGFSRATERVALD
jgi:hypothetical protein